MIDTVVFDVDGVLTASATVHLEAWTALFDEILPPEVDPFTRADYERLVDGRSRRDGLVAVLDDRRLLSPPRRGGGLDVEALAERKQRHFLAALDRHGSDLAFPDTIPCLGELRSLGYGLVAASSSRNARALLQAAGLIEQLDHIVDGEDLVRHVPVPAVMGPWPLPQRPLVAHARESMSSIDPSHDREAAVVKVTIYRHGEVIQVELCESADEAADLVASWEETRGVECEVEDLSATVHDSSASDPGRFRTNAAYPHSSESP